MKPLVVGVTGLAAGIGLQCYAFKRLPAQYKIDWLCDLDDGNVRNGISEYGGKGTQNFDEMLADPELELVTIATPVETHVPLAKKALLAGKHVLLEKPVAASVEEADDLIAAARKSGRLLCVDHQRRFYANQKAVRHAIETGALGRILSVRLDLPMSGGSGIDIPADPATFGRRFLKSHIYDYLVHHVDQICVLLGEKPKQIFARCQTLAGCDIPCEIEISLSMPCGILASASLRYSHALDVKWALDGDKASLRMQFANDMGPCFIYQRQKDGSINVKEVQPPHLAETLDDETGKWRAKNGSEIHGYTSIDGHCDFYRHLYVAVRHGGPVPACAEDARDAIKIIWLAMESAKTGKALAF